MNIRGIQFYDETVRVKVAPVCSGSHHKVKASISEKQNLIKSHFVSEGYTDSLSPAITSDPINLALNDHLESEDA